MQRKELEAVHITQRKEIEDRISITEEDVDDRRKRLGEETVESKESKVTNLRKKLRFKKSFSFWRRKAVRKKEGRRRGHV